MDPCELLSTYCEKLCSEDPLSHLNIKNALSLFEVGHHGCQRCQVN